MNKKSHTLDNLPLEIIDYILNCDELTYIDICRLSCVSPTINLVAKNNKLWEKKFKKTFPESYIYYVESNIYDWKDEHCLRLKFRNDVLRKLQELSVELHFIENISNDQLKYFQCKAAEHPYGFQFVISELYQILVTEPKKNLTIKYYAKKVLRYVHHIYLGMVWRVALKKYGQELPLLRGACLLSDWSQLNLDSSNAVDKHMNEIVNLTIEEIKNKCPKHPVLKQNLSKFTCIEKEVLKISLWEPHHCKIILCALNEVMFKKLHFYGSTDIFTNPIYNYVDKVLDSRSGIPLTLCIIYEAAASYFGVVCLPVSFPGHFLLKWLERPNLQGNEAFTFIDVYEEGTFRTVDELRDLASGYEGLPTSATEAVSPLKILTTMCWNLVEIARQQDVEGKGYLNLCSALELLSILTPDDTDHKILLARVYLHLGINLTEVHCLLQEITTHDPTSHGVVGFMYRSCITTIETQKIKAETMKNKRQRRNGNCDVKFAVGMIMKHLKYKYRCVIYGWDLTCTAGKDWIAQMGVYDLKYKDQQPFYHVLVDDKTSRYAAQENLEIDLGMKPINHPEVGHYFESFCEKYYQPNAMKSQEYPDDNEAREHILDVMMAVDT
ncbi:f-box only protein 21 [Caerostris darwini]|uniref:F-box only protein 21 n=1 Tax=Caerostris darwini TaxID=1538125 RepID=A0AAV4P2J0_9ARAC|nr:f-box only protein 21 [Caerostris darwini]